MRLIQCLRGPTSPSGMVLSAGPSCRPKYRNTCSAVSKGTLPTRSTSEDIRSAFLQNGEIGLVNYEERGGGGSSRRRHDACDNERHGSERYGSERYGPAARHSIAGARRPHVPRRAP